MLRSLHPPFQTAIEENDISSYDMTAMDVEERRRKVWDTRSQVMRPRPLTAIPSYSPEAKEGCWSIYPPRKCVCPYVVGLCRLCADRLCADRLCADVECSSDLS